MYIKKKGENTFYTPYHFKRVWLLNHPKRLCSAGRQFILYPVFVNNLSIHIQKNKTDEPNRLRPR